jgi:hypothetical protein
MGVELDFRPRTSDLGLAPVPQSPKGAARRFAVH